MELKTSLYRILGYVHNFSDDMKAIGTDFTEHHN